MIHFAFANESHTDLGRSNYVTEQISSRTSIDALNE